MVAALKSFLFFLALMASTLAAQPNCSSLENKIAENNWLIELPESSLLKKPVHEGASGVNNDGIYQGQYLGQEVVVKKILPGAPVEVRILYTELRLYSQLSRLGFSPKFFGVMRFADGGFGLVSQKIGDSWVAKPHGANGNSIPQAKAEVSIAIRQQWYQRMAEIVTHLTKANLHMFDMQFLITRDGRAYIIDFEAYSIKKDPDVLRENLESLADLKRQLLGVP